MSTDETPDHTEHLETEPTPEALDPGTPLARGLAYRAAGHRPPRRFVNVRPPRPQPTPVTADDLDGIPGPPRPQPTPVTADDLDDLPGLIPEAEHLEDETEPAPEVGGPTLSLGAAVRATGVARSTLQRRLTAGAIAGATRTEAGGWSIPIGGLIRAGLMPTVTPPETPPGPTSGPPVETVADEVADLRAEVVRLRIARDQAEALAAERADHVADLRAALEALSRALPAGPVATVATPPTDPLATMQTLAPDPVAIVQTAPPAPRRRWWQRQEPRP